jgi:transcriptional regulator with XRE-family HTH domain
MATKSSPLVQFGLHVRKVRLAAGLTQEQFAARAGLDRTYISLVERGKRNPSLTNLLRLAFAAGVDLSILVKGL